MFQFFHQTQLWAISVYLVVPKQGSPPANASPDDIEQSDLPSQLKYKITNNVNSRNCLRLSVTCVYWMSLFKYLYISTSSPEHWNKTSHTAVTMPPSTYLG